MPTIVHPLILFALATGFAVAHTQSPLFFSNQNQYLLHGLADSGYGQLSHDWLANTKDPTPLFSAMVSLGYRIGGLWTLQAIYFLILMGYFISVWCVVVRLPGMRASRRTALGFAAMFTAAHAAIFRYLSVQMTDVDYPWYFQAGVAGQYVLGAGLQPSVFGVFLVASLAAFANDRPRLAAALAPLAAVMHPTYLLPAALLTLGYMAVYLRHRQWRLMFILGSIALAVALPVVLYTLWKFTPSTTTTFVEAQRILADVRIPHHTVVGKWLDSIALLQMAWAIAGLVALRKTTLFLPLLVAAIGAVMLSIIQVVTRDHTLALLFPWRVSVILVPLATAVFAIKLVNMITVGRISTILYIVLFIVEVVGGVAIVMLGIGYSMNEEERPVLEYIRNHPANHVYLIPTRIPPVGTGARGSVSTSFTPPPRPKPGSNLIPVDLQRFRLDTRAAIFVDFKSVPYADVEVLEWYRRCKLVEAWYKEPDWDRAGLHKQLTAEGITLILIPRTRAIHASFLDPIYTDDVYIVCRMKP